jgi:hypothetical protein
MDFDRATGKDRSVLQVRVMHPVFVEGPLDGWECEWIDCIAHPKKLPRWSWTGKRVQYVYQLAGARWDGEKCTHRMILIGETSPAADLYTFDD